VKNRHAIVVFACFASLFLFCYAPALFQNRQFGFRDSGHAYYPLYQRVQEEWNQGRWPLWEPEENGGMPLLGNPGAAVLYPGKLVFAVLPYAWGARIYIVMHSALAFAAMLVLLRSWGTSWAGSGLGALAYAFGLPILYQYCNVIYLVGAAWMPLGMHAVDQWLRLGRRCALCELAAVLAMQTLGCDAQSAYLLGLSGSGYALGLAWRSARTRAAGPSALGKPTGGRLIRFFFQALGLIAALCLWSAATVSLAILLPKLREPHPGRPAPPLWWMPRMPLVVAVAWSVAAVGFLYFYYWRRRGSRQPLGVMCLGLAAAAALAAGLMAAQLLPVVEFIGQTARAAATGPHGIYIYSLEPYRLVELVWPNIGGMQFGQNSYWPDVIQIPGVHPRMWVPSLYAGGLTVILALAALSLRREPPWRVWLSAIALIGALGAMGQYTSPIWATRTAIALTGSPQLARLAADLGPLGAPGDSPIRQDGFLKDGDGSIYWLMATFLPGARQFRYPEKLFSLTSLALAALAGTGWDLVCSGRTRRAKVAIALLIAISLCILAAVVVERRPILATFESYVGTLESGPLNATQAYDAILRSLVHCLLVLGAGLALVFLAPARPQLCGAAALILMTLDLASANARYVMTVEQSMFDSPPGLVQIIEKAESARNPPVPGPFRVHRMPAWSPVAWNVTRSKDRESEIVAWERETLGARWGVNFGIEYTFTITPANLSDFDWYFSRFHLTAATPEIASWLGTPVGQPVIYYPRRAFDMWNTRYFIVPAFANGWRDQERATAAFRFESELIYPEKNRFAGSHGKEESKEWLNTQDFEVLRNEQAFPRSWVVHRAHAIKPVEGLAREPRSEARNEILYSQDPLWNDPALTLFDPHAVAWVSEADLAQIAPKLSGRPPSASESVSVRYPNPQRAVLEVTLESPGLVILADVHYPGWQLAIDEQPAPIYPVNVSMRGALVSAGPHRLVYTFAPRSFQIGLVVSIFGLAAWLALALFCVFRPTHPVLAAGRELEPLDQMSPRTR
jgi:hypothetical protein